MMRPILVNLHIPKCAGSVVGSLMRHHVGAGRTFGPTTGAQMKAFRAMQLEQRDAMADALVGHLWRWNAHRYFSRDCIYFSALRDPISRVCSYFNYIHERPQKRRLHPLFKSELPSLDLLPGIKHPLVLGILGPCYGTFLAGVQPADGDTYPQVERHVVRQIRRGRLKAGALPVLAETMRQMGMLAGEAPRVNERRAHTLTDYEPATPSTLAPRTVAFLRDWLRYDIQLVEAVDRIGTRPEGWAFAPWPRRQRVLSRAAG